MALPPHQESRGTDNPSLAVSSPEGRFPYRRLVPALVVVVPILLIFGYSWYAGLPVESAPLPVATPATVQPTSTVVACAPDLVRPEVERMQALMLEFYDASALASQTPTDKLLLVIPSLQEIRRRADALKVSDCVEKLKAYQIAHMNMVINTMLAFMSKSDPSFLVEGIIQSRLLNEEYKKEKARLLDEVYMPPPTQEPSPTVDPQGVTPSVTP